MYQDRPTVLQPTEYTKSRLCHRDARWRRNPQYIVYAMHLKQMKSVDSAIYSCMKGSSIAGMNAGEFTKRVASKKFDQDLEVKLNSFMAPVIGSKVGLIMF